MKKLNIKELAEYIPKCIICQKDMYLFIQGNLSSTKHKFTGKKINLKTKIEDGYLISSSKDYKFNIRLDTSEILEGQEFFNTLFKTWTYLNKRCNTCDFIIGTMYNEPFTEYMGDIFPQVKLTNETVHYTLPGGKDIHIDKRYFDHHALLGEQTLIKINNKMLPPFPIDFSAIKNRKQLNNRILTIRTFQ